MPTAADLVAALRQTGLLPPAQLGEVMRDLLNRFPEGRALAAELLRRGWLTAYQVNQLLQGRGDRLVLGPYHLLERLGQGGMGQVFKARHGKLGRVVAVKVIRKERLDHPDAVRRFRREIEAAAQLSHPNIVLALDADQAGDTHFFAMEYVAGTDLHRHVKEHGPLPVRQACEYVRQAALGLQHAFERGLVHRDIKPHNLLLKLPKPSGASEPTADGDSTGTVKILDMGLARFRREGDTGESSSTLTQEGSVMGTLDYISPEQARDSHAVDIRADLYSLGCTLYFLLSGRVPFPGGTATVKLLRHQNEEPTPVEQLRPDTPPDVAAVVRKLMAKRAEDRFQTPAELAEALAAVLHEDGSRAPAASPHRTVAAQGPARSPFADLDDLTMPATPPPSAGQVAARRRAVWMVGIGAGISLTLATVFAVVLINSLGGARSVDTSKKQPPGDPLQAARDTAAQKKAEEDKQRAETAEAERKRQAEADEALKPLAAKAGGSKTTFGDFATDVAAFKGKYGGTPAAAKAAELLMKLPSPLDQLDPAKIPEDAKAAWKAAGFDGKDVVAVLGEHRGRQWAVVNCVAYSPDGRYVAICGQENDVYLREADSMQLDAILRGHTAAVRTLAFTSDSKQLISAGRHGDDTLRVWDVATRQLLKTLQTHGEILSIAVSRDGQRLLAGHADGSIRLWDVTGAKELRRLEGHKNEVYGLAFLPDGRRALSGSGGLHKDWTLRVWDVDTATELKRIDYPHYVRSIAVSADGRRCLVGSQDGTVRLWDVERLEEVMCCTPSGPHGDVIFVAFLPGERRAAAAYQENAFRLWDLDKAQELRRFEGHGSTVPTLSPSPDGRHIVSGSADGTVRLWDVATGKEVQPLTGPVGPTYALDFAADGRQLLSGGADNRVRLWDVLTDKLIQSFEGTLDNGVFTVKFSADGTQILGTCYGAVNAWQRDDGRKVRDFHHVPWVEFLGERGGVVSADRVLFPEADSSFVLKDLGQDQVIAKFNGLPANGSWFVVSPDARQLLTSSDDGTVRLWDALTGKELRQFKVAGRPMMAFSPDGRYVYSLLHRTLRRWSLADGPAKEQWVQPTVGAAPVNNRVSVSPDGRIVSTSSADGEVILWDAASGAKLREWRLPGSVSRVAFAPDGRHLATANGNGTVYILRLADGPPRALSAAEAKKQQEDEAKRLGVPVQITNSIGMKLNLIPAGRFLMGSPENEPGRQPNEGPQHEVTITRPFHIGVYEVTQAEYEKVTGTNPSHFNKANGGGPDHPVETVSWDDAVAFCKKLSELPEEKKAGRVYRLPTEAEWEYACRAGTRTAYSFGDEAGKLGEYAWFAGNSEKKTHPIGKRSPNPWGLYDMHGNAWEWVLDQWDADYYRRSPAKDPQGPSDTKQYFGRGGGFHNLDLAADFRSAKRGGPSASSFASEVSGLRVVCELPVAAEHTKDGPR